MFLVVAIPHVSRRYFSLLQKLIICCTVSCLRPPASKKRTTKRSDPSLKNDGNQQLPSSSAHDSGASPTPPQLPCGRDAGAAEFMQSPAIAPFLQLVLLLMQCQEAWDWASTPGGQQMLGRVALCASQRDRGRSADSGTSNLDKRYEAELFQTLAIAHTE